MNRLSGRACLVSGSTGIAAAAAHRFAAEGADTFVVSRTTEHARELAERIVDAGGSCGWMAAELTDEDAADAAVAACVARFGRIDGLFSVAGGSGRRFGDGPIHTVGRDAWDRTLELNLTTQALVCRSVVARMRAQEPNASGTRGSILLMGSVTATDPAPEFFATHAYAAAKGAINALMTTMAAAYLPDRIRVNVVAPGLTATPMARRAAGDAAIRAYGSRTITGQLLKVDGGWSVASVSPERGRSAGGTDP